MNAYLIELLTYLFRLGFIQCNASLHFGSSKHSSNSKNPPTLNLYVHASLGLLIIFLICCFLLTLSQRVLLHHLDGTKCNFHCFTSGDPGPVSPHPQLATGAWTSCPICIRSFRTFSDAPLDQLVLQSICFRDICRFPGSPFLECLIRIFSIFV